MISFNEIRSAVKTALETQERNESAQIALHLNIVGEETDRLLDQILSKGAPQGLLASEAFSTALAALAEDEFKITYAGQIGQNSDDLIRCYTIQKLMTSPNSLL